MKRIALALSAALIFVSACNDASETKTTEGTNSSDTSKMASEVKKDSKMDATPITIDSATMMQKWMDFAKPGPVHEMIAKSNGTWTGEVTSWMDPKAPPTKSTVTTVNKMVMGGRYQMGTNTGSTPWGPFEGLSMLGYDNVKKVLVNTWIDNMGTGIMILEGPWDEGTKSATLTGKMTDPLRNTEIDCRQVFKIIDDNTQMMEMYCPGMDGKESKSMEIKFTRKK